MNANPVPPLDLGNLQEFIVVAVKKSGPPAEDRHEDKINDEFAQAAGEDTREYEPEP